MTSNKCLFVIRIYTLNKDLNIYNEFYQHFDWLRLDNHPILYLEIISR